MTKTAIVVLSDEDTETDSESEEEGDTAGDDTFTEAIPRGGH